MALPPAVVEQSTNKLFSYISNKIDEKASSAETIARIEIAIRRISFVLEKTGKIAITYVSLLDNWNGLKRVYINGMDQLNKYNQTQELDGQVVVRSSSYFHRIAKRAANFPMFSLVGFVNKHLSPSVATTFERYADWAEKTFVAQVESSCPLHHDNFRYPIVRHLFEGKTLRFARKKGKQHSCFFVYPVILEGRGVEALLGYMYSDPKRLEKSFFLSLMLRISESTDIVGTAINCLRSVALLLDIVNQDAVGELSLLHNFQDIAYSYRSLAVEMQQYLVWTKKIRSDPLCCQAENGHVPSINNIISSELSESFPEQTIMFAFQYYLRMPECKMASASEERHRNTMVDHHGCLQPHDDHFLIRYAFAPHFLPHESLLAANCTTEMTLDNDKKGHGHTSIPGNSGIIQENMLSDRHVEWICTHGAVSMKVEQPCEDIVSVTKARRSYETRSAKKRKT